MRTNAACEKIVEENISYALSIGKRYKSLDDQVQVSACLAGLQAGSKSWDRKRGNLRQHIKAKIRCALAAEVKKTGRLKRIPSRMLASENNLGGIEQSSPAPWRNLDVAAVKRILTVDEFSFLSMYYLDGLTINDIAIKLGIKRALAYYRLERILSKARAALE